MTPLFVKVDVDGRTIEFAVDHSWTDPIADVLAAGRFPDSRSNELWRHLIHSGGRLVDVGAHIGTYSLPALAAGASVLAVEGSEGNATLLRLAAEANGFDGLEILHAAASHSSGTVGFTPAGPWGQITFENGPADVHPGLPTPAVALDDVLVERKWAHVDLIKIDIEGSELDALAGMQGCLAGQGSPQVIIEVNGHALHQYGHTPHDVLAVLENHGYRCYLIDPPPGYLLVPVASNDLQPDTVADYVAFKEVPTALEPWSIGAPLDRSEVIRRLVATCSHENIHHRQYGARLLAEAPAWILEDESIEQLPRSPEIAGLILAAGRQRSERWGAALRMLERRSDLVGFGLSSRLKGVAPVSMMVRDGLRRALLEVFFRQSEFNRSSGELIRGHETQLQALGTAVTSQLQLQAGAEQRLEAVEQKLAGANQAFAGATRGGDREAARRLRGLDAVSLAERFNDTGEARREHLRGLVARFDRRSDVIDAGCGRGEFLELLRQADVSAVGVDRDEAMADWCRQQGLDAVRGEILEFLRRRPEQSHGGIFAGYLIECLERGEIVDLVRLAFSRIRPGGVIVFETVHPLSWLTYAGLRGDFADVVPVPPLALKWLAESCGFVSVTIECACPVPEALKPRRLPAAGGEGPEVEAFNRGVAAANEVLFGRLGYTLTATRPAE